MENAIFFAIFARGRHVTTKIHELFLLGIPFSSDTLRLPRWYCFVPAIGTVQFAGRWTQLNSEFITMFKSEPMQCFYPYSSGH